VVTVTDDRIVSVTMPKWGLSMQLGKITAWAVAEGDEVKAGDDVADIETEKITGTLEASDDGTVRRLIARVGEDVPVGGTIALLAPADVSDEALDAAALQARAVIDAGVPDDAAGAAELQTADVGGRKISYAGTGEQGDVVLLVHGYGGDRNSWLFLQEPLAARYRVYALDLPGHGTSAKDVGDGTLDVLAGAVTGVLDALGAGRAHLVGHSMGGLAVSGVAQRHPERVDRLLMVCPLPPVRSPGPELRAEAEAARRRGRARVDAAGLARLEELRAAGLPARDPAAFCREHRRVHLPRQLADPASVDRVRSDPCALPNEFPDRVEAHLARLFAAFGDWDWRPAAATIRAPTLVVQGTEDGVPLAAARLWSDAIPGARLLPVERAGHYPWVERPELFFPAAETFLRGGWPDGARAGAVAGRPSADT
jgi:pimeloyl-ACP methyl ester carboxylesterase